MQHLWSRARELLRFDGRVSRLDYWRRVLLLTASLALILVVGIVAVMAAGPVGGLVFLAMAPVFLASIANSVRRLHDRGRGWLWAGLFLIGPWTMAAIANDMFGQGAWLPAFVASLVSLGVNLWGLVEIGFRRGKPGDNRYGPAPA